VWRLSSSEIWCRVIWLHKHFGVGYVLHLQNTNYVGTGLALFSFLKAMTMTSWNLMGEWRWISTISDVDTRWTWVISFMPWPLYPRERRLGRSQSQSGQCEREKNPLLGMELRSSSHRPVCMQTETSQLPAPDSSCPCNRPWKPIGLWDVEASTFSGQSYNGWRWDCQPYEPAAIYSQGDSWY
jgi:hypothetical protein